VTLPEVVDRSAHAESTTLLAVEPEAEPEPEAEAEPVAPAVDELVAPLLAPAPVDVVLLEPLSEV
jgi:hypothetical protein